MAFIKRQVNLKQQLRQNSHFLLGPRAVGKSALIKQNFFKAVTTQNQSTGYSKLVKYINLLDSRVYLRLKADPSLLESMAHQKKYVVIDEIQRIPALLNEVHRLIEEFGTHFLLTGSSARKLKKGDVNLLAGRAFKSSLFPLTWRELSQNKKFNLNRYLLRGGLPLAYLGPHSEEYLYNYVDTYLKEEIQSEALVRSLPNYTRFLQNMALSNAQQINYTKVANSAGLSPNTVRDYFQILEDTLIGFSVSPYRRTKKRKPIQTSKFYLFDTGVTNTLCETKSLPIHSDLFGRAFEQFIACELRAFLSYNKIRQGLCYWRSQSQFEVDFVIGDQIAIEVKSSKKVSPRDHKGLLALQEEQKWKHLLIVSQDPVAGHFKNGIQHLPYEVFLKKLWNLDLV